MKKLLLIAGDLATGKSTFGAVLAKRYGVVALYKDRFKETLGDTIGFSNREENMKLSFASAALMRMIFSSFTSVDADLILESNFRQEELELLHDIAGERGYQVLTVVLRGDLEILHRRFLHRLHHENRHVVHASGGMEDYNIFVSYVTKQRHLVIPGDMVQVCADDFSYQTDEALLSRLDRFMKS